MADDDFTMDLPQRGAKVARRLPHKEVVCFVVGALTDPASHSTSDYCVHTEVHGSRRVHVPQPSRYIDDTKVGRAAKRAHVRSKPSVRSAFSRSGPQL